MLSCLGRVMLSSFNVFLINMLSLFVLGSGTLGHLSTFSMIYVANKFSVLCLFAALSCQLNPNLVYHWRRAGDSFCFYYAIMLYVYFSEMSTRQQRMMLKIIQINSFLFLLIRPSPSVEWQVGPCLLYLGASIPGPYCLVTWADVHLLGGASLVIVTLFVLWRQQQVSEACLLVCASAV